MANPAAERDEKDRRRRVGRKKQQGKAGDTGLPWGLRSAQRADPDNGLPVTRCTGGRGQAELGADGGVVARPRGFAAIEKASPALLTFTSKLFGLFVCRS
jgi:hypothetical protein